MATRTYCRRSIQERRHILEKYDQLPIMSLNAAARLLNVSSPLLRVWLQKRNNIKNAKSYPPRPVYSSCKTPQVEAALWSWIDSSIANGITVNDPMIRRKATQVATDMGLCKFQATPVWLSRFKSREQVIREMFQVDHAAEPPKFANDLTDQKKYLVARKTHRLEAALWRWIDHTRQSDVNLNESIIRFKAARLAKMFGYHSFRASAVWYRRFMNREGVIREMFQTSKKNQPEVLTLNKKEMANTSTKMQQLEDVLWRWVNRCREKGVTVNDSVILSEASLLAKRMGFSSFQSNKVWLKCFKARERFEQGMLQLNQCPENTPSDQTEDEGTSDQTQQSDDSNETDQSDSASEVLSDLDIPILEPTVVSAELNGDLHTVTVPSLWQMKEAMKTLATGLLYRGFCDFKLLHRFEKEVDAVLRRSVTHNS